MTFSPGLRRAALLGSILGVAACDVASFINDPKPIFEQTWNVPAESSTVSVASLLPPGVTILGDSSAFQMNVTFLPFSRRVGDDCPPCQTQNGTTAIKPAFVLVTGSTTTLPQDVVSGTLTGGLVNLAITNNLSFDPLRVKSSAPASTDPTQQGRMVIVVRSGSLVIGKDSVNGATTPFAPGSVLNRAITILQGNITSALAVDLTLTSPVSDNTVFINANGTLASTVAVPDLRIAQVRMNVVNRNMLNVGGDSLPLDGLDASITDHVVRGTLRMTITNPFNVAGNLSVRFGYGTLPSEAITKTVALPTGVNQIRSVTLDRLEMSNLFGRKVGLTVSGAVNSTAPIDVTPRQTLTISNRLIMTIRIGEVCDKDFFTNRCIPGGT